MDDNTKEILKNCMCNFSKFIFHLLWFSKNSPLDTNLQMLRNLVLSLPEDERRKYGKEYEFIREIQLDRLHEMIFPYLSSGESCASDDIAGRVGRECKMPYLLHDGKKLFFPRKMTERQAYLTYRHLLDVEGITGKGILEKSPHNYQSTDFKVEDGDVLLDVGSAEALFTLDNIERVQSAFVFEYDSRWHKPLKATFKSFASKVTIVPKIVAGHVDRHSITLQDAVKVDKTKQERLFVKMDIEGGERDVISGNVDFFRANRVKLSCCVYHRQDDAEVIGKMLKDIGFTVSYSDGFMLPAMNGIHFPYFRHGVIYARNY